MLRRALFCISQAEGIGLEYCREPFTWIKRKPPGQQTIDVDNEKVTTATQLFEAGIERSDVVHTQWETNLINWYHEIADACKETNGMSS